MSPSRVLPRLAPPAGADCVVVSQIEAAQLPGEGGGDISDACTVGGAVNDTTISCRCGPFAYQGPGVGVLCAPSVTHIDDYHNEPREYIQGDPTDHAFRSCLRLAKVISAVAAPVLVLKVIYAMSASANERASGLSRSNWMSALLGNLL